MSTVLEVSGVSYSYHTLSGETPALSNITFSVPEGEFLAIVGPSGCGKSTLLSMIASLMEPESGTISIHGTPASMSRQRIGYMLQKDHLFEWRTIYKNVILGLEIQNRMTEKNLEHVEQLLRDYGLDQFRNARPSELSGGMRQRAALIRTLALNPDLLLLDEPFSALDYQTRLQVCDDVYRIIRKEKKTYSGHSRSVRSYQQWRTGSSFSPAVLQRCRKSSPSTSPIPVFFPWSGDRLLNSSSILMKYGRS